MQSSNQAIKQSSNQAIKQSKRSVKAFTRLSSALVMGMALLASGQVFATFYDSRSNIGSAADFTDGNKWSTVPGCPGGAPVGVAITPASTDFFDICSGNSLTLAATDVVNFGILLFDATGGWGGGVLKFSSGNKEIRNFNSSLAPIALNIASMTTGDTINISMLAVTFSSVTGGSLTCGGTAYTAGTSITGGTTCTVTVVAAPPAISAPIGIDFNKPAKVFTTEIKVK
jgi:hypothetical protein